MIVLLFVGFQAKAQSSLEAAPVDTTINKDSTQQLSILIVPFNPAMYFSDADKDISEQSNVDQTKVKDKFSGSLESTLNEHIGLYYDTKSISKQPDAVDDLDIIFGSINYKAETKQKEEAPKEEGEEESSAKKFFKGLKKTMNSVVGDTTQKAENTESYMNISFDDNRLIKFLTEKYKSEYVLFINQFEVKTDYENCIDLQLRKYYREIKVHYTLVSKDGKQVSGNVITLPYHSNENKVENIVKENFGEVSNQILNKIYKQK
ncbi:MAG: hypothetical protein EP332_00450 [Bacteroidetes bacterium]|nr:MAG: hypothetical protein EP332_00450 [Bacteroidota bacterium]